jgi:hypothetical protein
MGDNERILELLVEWEERRRRGEDVTPEQLCPDDPALQAELRRRLHKRRKLQQFLDQTAQPGDAAPPPLPRVEGYEVIDVLGAGGMGVVYKALQVALRRPVALKMILAGPVVAEADRRRFRTEAEAAARLNHPNIVQVYEVGEQDQRPFLALEFVPGGSLAEQLQDGPLPPRRAAEVLAVLAGAVRHAHEQGIVHRDLKPANVLLTEQGVPKVADFGLAKLLDADQAQTRTGAILGTPGYMAPEQALGRAGDVGPRTDVYALGAILYELLTGRPPFTGATVLETLEQVRSLDPVPPRRVQPHCPRDLETVCLKCLEKDPARRYQSAQALAEDLGRFREGRPVLARPTPARERLAKWARRHPAVAALVAVLAVGAVASFTALTLLWRKAEDAVTEREAALGALHEEARSKDAALKRVRQGEYGLRVQAARAAWLGEDLDLAGRLLDGCDPALRDADWHKLHLACHALEHTWTFSELPPVGVVVGTADASVVFLVRGSSTALGLNKFLVFDAAAPDRPPRELSPLATLEGLALTAEGQVAVLTKPRFDMARVGYMSPDDGKEVRSQIFERKPSIRTAVLGPGARRLALVSDGKPTVVEVLDLQSNQTWTFEANPKKAVGQIAFSVDGRWLAVARTGAISVWEVGSDRGTHTWKFPEPPPSFNRLAVSPTGTVAFIFQRPGKQNLELWLLDVQGGKVLHSWVVPRLTSSVYGACAFSPDGRLVMVGGQDRAITVWEVDTGKEWLTLRGSPKMSLQTIFTADGRRLVTGGFDGAIRVWKVRAQ